MSAGVSGLSGVQDLYLVFTGGSGYLLNLNWFSFTETPTTYSLSYSASTGGSISGNGSQTVDHGADGSAVSAVADGGYAFVDWSDGSTANPRTDLDVTSNLSVTANFDLSIGDGIVAHWALDAGSGSTVADSTGHGFAGTMTGASWVAGPLSFSSDTVALLT